MQNTLYIIAALCVLLWGMYIIQFNPKNKSLKMIIGFVTISMLAPITDSLYVWFVELILIIVMWYKSGKVIRFTECSIYILFLLWALFTLLYSSNFYRGVKGIIMYAFPLLFYVLTVLAVRSKKDVRRLCVAFERSLIPFAILGLFALFIGQFSTIQVYYGMSVCVIPFIFHRKKRTYQMMYIFLCALPAMLLVKRTPLLGMALALSVTSVLLYRFKALLPIIISLLVAVVVLFSIPQFRSKMFLSGEDTALVNISHSSDLSDDLNTNGRNVFWLYLYDKFVEKNPYFGAGVGSVKSFVQSNKNEYKSSFFMVHNDWLLILCEMGIVGVLLLLLFFIYALAKCVKYSSRSYPIVLRLVSSITAGNLACTMLHMFFENCTNSFVFPISFVFYAVLVNYVKIYERRVKMAKIISIKNWNTDDEQKKSFGFPSNNSSIQNRFL